MRAKKISWKLGFFVGIPVFILYLLFSARGIYTGDTGDLVTAAYQFGVPHPPGYPLWTFLAWILTKLPLLTVSWRVTLLSSLPHALVVILVYAVVYRITHRVLPALFGASVLAGNYLFFLYSITPEVFALFDLFIVLHILLLLLWNERHEKTILLSFLFLFGLSLAHHHVILFFVPSYLWFLWSGRKQYVSKHPQTVRMVVVYCAVFFLGLLPYVYIPVAARGNAIVNWDKATDVDNFIRLVTRRDYGTFKSGAVYGQLASQRFVQIRAYARFLFIDLTPVGILLAGIGLFFLWKRHSRIFYFLAIALASVGPLYFFYASFPLMNQFMLGTYERFILPSYVLCALLIGVGLHGITLFIERSVKRFHATIPVHIYSRGVAVVFFIFPVSMLAVNSWKFAPLPRDRTAEFMADDVLSTVPLHSILLLGRDTTFFTTQYVRYVLGYRTDVILLPINNFSDSQYRKVMRSVFPDLRLPETEGVTFLEEFIRLNGTEHEIFTNNLIPIGDEYVYVQHGLLYKIVSASSTPELTDLMALNDTLWSSYHDPRAGILSHYNHLMLSDVRDVYSNSLVLWAKYLLTQNKPEEAKKYLTLAIAYGGDNTLPDAYSYLGLSHLALIQCKEALDSFQTARTLNKIPDAKLIYYEAVTYRYCLKDEDRAGELFAKYEQERKTGETQLKDL